MPQVVFNKHRPRRPRKELLTAARSNDADLLIDGIYRSGMQAYGPVSTSKEKCCPSPKLTRLRRRTSDRTGRLSERVGAVMIINNQIPVMHTVICAAIGGDNDSPAFFVNPDARTHRKLAS